jgi:hypothetical protein
MKFVKPLVNLCLLLMFVMQQAIVFSLLAQTNSIEERIKRVENNLLPRQIVFVKDATGRTTEMVINVNGQEIHLKKI